MPKRSAKEQSPKGAKRARNVLTLQKKVEILDKLARGESAASVGRLYGVNESTVRTIRKSEATIRSSVAAGTSKSAKVSFMPRDKCLVKMEKALALWMDDMEQRHVPMDTNIVKSKALSLFKKFKEEAGGGGIREFPSQQRLV